MARSRRLSPAVLWDVPTGDPIKDLSAAAATIIANSGLIPDTVVFGAEALAAFLNNNIVQEQMNKLHIVAGGISPTAPQGVGTAQFIGTLYRPYVRLFGYTESYEDEATNALKLMIDPKLVLVGCSKSPALTSYGSVSQVEQDGEVRSYSDLKFVPRKLTTPKEDRTEIRIASRPCLIPFDLASWSVIKPLTGALQTLQGDDSKKKGDWEKWGHKDEGEKNNR